MPIILDGTNGISTPTVTYEGNVVITGTGRRILGDFQNATLANRVMFQNSVTNGATSVGAMPNGTGANCAYNIFAGSDVTNTSFGQFRVGTDTGDVRIVSGQLGTGTFMPITMFTGGSERLRIDTSGNVGIGTTLPSTFNPNTSFNKNLTIFQGDQATTLIAYWQAGVDQYSLLRANNGANTGITNIRYEANTHLFLSGNGASGTERMRIDSSGSVVIGATAVESSSAVPRLFVVAGSNNNTTIQTMPCGLAIKNTHNEAVTAYGVSLKLHLGAGGEIGKYGAIAAVADGGFANSIALAFYTNGNGANGADNTTEKMRIAGSGAVMIGGTIMPTGMSGGAFLIDGSRPLSYNNGEGSLNMKANAGGWQMGTYIIGSSGTRLGGFGFAGGNDSLGYVWAGQSGSGTGVQLANGGTSWASLSDIREKVVYGQIENALSKIDQIRPVYYNYNSDTSETPRRVGFIAQEVQAVLPEAVTELQIEVDNPTEETKRLSLAYTEVVPLLLAAIQEQQAIIETFKSRLDAAGL